MYGVVRRSRPLKVGPIGIDAHWPDVYLIEVGDLAAVASDVSSATLDPTRDRVLAHDRVNQAVMGDRTVIPMNFGMVCRSRKDAVKLLRAAHDAFSEVLQKVEDRVEFGLKVLLPADVPVDPMPPGPPTEGDLESRAGRHLDEGLQRLREVSVASRLTPPVGDRMILNAAFLVPRNGESKFVDRTKEIARKFPHLVFRYTGPWPPYNFVNVRLKLERVA
ncbi:GvpL/GvpF family gas vesicle protein [Usitatibacter palustris]|uniref:GvpL/GvpF family gas vesicle protein n=1 Tax=Usitatibacter palustris TaxID=2732487 RepID=UPI001487C362|nr:GvpL/GvpF family gas vesicle protein [Usitatibacter palustris]